MKHAVLLIAALCAACAPGFVPPPLARNPVEGEILVSRGAEQNRYHADICSAGAREMFYGFDVGSAADPKVRLRAVVDPIGGSAVKVTTPDAEYVVRDRDCETLRVDVRPTGWRVNEDRDYEGSVVMDCRAGDTQLRADLTIRACH